MRNLFKYSLFSLYGVVGTLAADNGVVDYWYADTYCNPAPCAQAAPCAQQADCGCGQFSIGGDWLYWKVEQEQMEFGALVTISPDDDLTVINSDVIKPKFTEHDGYRYYIDYVTADKDWKLSAAFTHVPTSASVSVAENPSVTMDFISIFGVNFPILEAIAEGTFDEVSGKWNATIEYLDIDVTRNICFNDTFQINPHIGLRGFWSDQKFKIDGSSAEVTFASRLKQKVKGIGLEAGLWGELRLCNGFYLVGHVGGGLIYSKYRNSGTLDADADDGLARIHYNDSNYMSNAMVDTFLGVKYVGCIQDFAFNAHVGWEQHIIFGTNQFSVSGNANMTLQGVTLGGGFAF